jgi:hypothetical protein
MIRRLEQLAALVVAGGLAIVSYWLFFSWFQGGGSDRRRPSSPSSEVPAEVRTTRSASLAAVDGVAPPAVQVR